MVRMRVVRLLPVNCLLYNFIQFINNKCNEKTNWVKWYWKKCEASIVYTVNIIHNMVRNLKVNCMTSCITFIKSLYSIKYYCITNYVDYNRKNFNLLGVYNIYRYLDRRIIRLLYQFDLKTITLGHNWASCFLFFDNHCKYKFLIDIIRSQLPLYIYKKKNYLGNYQMILVSVRIVSTVWHYFKFTWNITTGRLFYTYDDV